MRRIIVLTYFIFCWWLSRTIGITMLSALVDVAAISYFVAQILSIKPASVRKLKENFQMETKSLSQFLRNHFHFSTFASQELLLSTYQKQQSKIDMTKKSTAGKTAKKKVAKKVATKTPKKKPSASAKKDEVKTETPKTEKQIQNRDVTTYNFDGQKLGKGLFVLALVKHYVKHHPNATEKDLKEIFPDSIIQRYGVFTDLKTAETKSKTSGKKRYFINPDQVIKIGAKDYAVTNQWTSDILAKLLAHLKEKGVKIAK
jgi:transposase-like protein